MWTPDDMAAQGCFQWTACLSPGMLSFIGCAVKRSGRLKGMPSTRKYEQRLRAKAADQTRRRILDAVYQRLVEAPSEQVSMDKVAKLAEVSRSTIYTVFGSRAGLFDALGMDLLHRGGFTDMVMAVLQPDARRGLRDGITGNVHMYAAHPDVLRAPFSR